MALLSLEKVSFSYDKRHNAVNDVSLSVEKGEYVAVIGHNGSGKSTLAKLFNGLVKPDQGKVIVDGFSLDDKKSTFEVRKRVGVVFQNPDNQLIASIVEDDIAFGPENLGIPREEIGKRIDFALSAVGMEGFRKSSPTRLSGGQKQRIAIAGVLAVKPQILVLDESTAMLDPKGRKEVIEVVRTLNKERGMTVIDITHYMDEAVEADEICIMGDGVIMAQGNPSEIFAKKDVIKECGLELPVSAKLAEVLQKEGLPLPDGILTKEELSKSLCELLQKI